MSSGSFKNSPFEVLSDKEEKRSLLIRLNEELARMSPCIADLLCVAQQVGDGLFDFEFHFKSDQFLGHSIPRFENRVCWFFENISRPDQPAFQSVVCKALQGSFAVSEVRISDVNGAERLCWIFGKPVRNETTKNVIACIIAISEVKSYSGSKAEIAHQNGFSNIIETILNNSVLIDSEGKIVAFSEKVKNLLQIPSYENLTGLHLREIFADSRAIVNIVGNEVYVEQEMLLTQADQGEKWLLACSYPVEKSSSARGCNFIVFRDITACKLQHLALIDSEKKFRTMAENFPGFIFLELDRRIAYANSKAEEFFGFNKEELMDSSFDLNRLFDESAGALKAKLAKKLEKDETARVQGEVKAFHKNGETRDCILSVQAMPFKGRRAFLGILTDISEIAAARRRSTESQERYWTLFDSMTDAIFLETIGGTILDCNAEAERCYGYSRHELLGMNACELVSGEAISTLESIEEYLKKQKKPARLHASATGKRKDGSIFPVEVTIAEVTINQEALFLVTVRDISLRREIENSRKRYDSQLQKIQMLDSFGNVVNGLTNDFNNILTGVIGYADLAMRDLSPSSTARYRIKKIIEASRKGREVIQQLIASTGKLPAIFQKADIVCAVKDFLREHRAKLEEKCRLEIEIKEDLPEVVFDRNQFQNAIENLVSNSLEAIDGKNGVISISLGRGEISYDGSEPGFFGPPVKAGEYISIKVKDNGKGISAENLPRIFEPFFTTKFLNRGLGLATVLGMVRSHHWGIIVKSEESKGSEFTLLIPANCEKSDFVSRVEKKMEGFFPAGSALIIDDDDAVSDVFLAQLDSLGFETFRAIECNRGLELFKRLHRNLSLVILDLTMPGKTGYELLKELRWLNPEIPVIICTGLDDISQELEQYGVDVILKKPFQLSDVEKAILKARIIR
ncbi:MAG: hypothetical protein Kow0029_09720 [Candidatus Rifleibacteriota bacterium]